VLRATLDELVRRNALGRYEWQTEAWTAAAVCKLYAPQWARDRVVHQVRPAEAARALPPPQATGQTLKAWRKGKRYSQVQAAKALGVSVATVERAEAPASVSKPLGKALREALAKAGLTSVSGDG
jgi:DNA-binding transcriptional regulator YiaG